MCVLNVAILELIIPTYSIMFPSMITLFGRHVGASFMLGCHLGSKLGSMSDIVNGMSETPLNCSSQGFFAFRIFQNKLTMNYMREIEVCHWPEMMS